MVFAHDTEHALVAAAALVNTDSAVGDLLPDPASLSEFLTRWQWTGSRAGDVEELATVRALRPSLRLLWELEEAALVRLVNEMLRDGEALPRLVVHDGWGPHLHATDDDAPLAQRMLVEAAMALVDVVRLGELDRLRACANDDCTDVVVDLSKNRSRRYCSTACANRVNVAAFRARRAGRTG